MIISVALMSAACQPSSGKAGSASSGKISVAPSLVILGRWKWLAAGTFGVSTVLVLFLAFTLGLSVLLDGFDLAVGALPQFRLDDRLHDRMVDAIAPTWDNIESWLSMAGVALLAAFPITYGILLPASVARAARWMRSRLSPCSPPQPFYSARRCLG